MKKFPTTLFSVLFITAVTAWTWYSQMPQKTAEPSSQNEFSTERALKHVRSIANQPHYTGSPGHKHVANYIIGELRKLGVEAELQKGFSVTERGVLAYAENIVARIPGSGSSKALLLLSHYDSAPHSNSRGAADDASGIATILEGLRAYMHSKTPHKNDIIVLFTDTEEIGLNGAALFVNKHPWAKDVGLCINFEARGTAGPSYMLMEVNNGNAAMIKGFSDASPSHPATNSLMYSIYKMLPNDTDLTVFRENGNVQGFNFAFIDNHFNYHTIQDDVAHLDLRSLTHQGTYLMPLLHYFANANLTNLNAEEDYVYFSTPLSMVRYPFSWVSPMVIISCIILGGLLVIGFGKKLLNGRLIARGFLLYFSCILLLPVLTYYGWQLILASYPGYTTIPHGFTYNGHLYIAAFLSLSLVLLFAAYHKKATHMEIMNYHVAPLSIVLMVNIAIASFLPGAGFLIIPLLCSLTSFGWFIVTQRINYWMNLLLTAPACIILCPLAGALPVGLGLKSTYMAVIILVMGFGLLLPVLLKLRKRKMFALVLLFVSAGFFLAADFNSDFEEGKAKPDSLVYILDKSTGTARWASYDQVPDAWTSEALGPNPTNTDPLPGMSIGGKYNSSLRLSATAPMVNIPGPFIEYDKDTVKGNRQYHNLTIIPNRPVNRYDLYILSEKMPGDFTANGETMPGFRRTNDHSQKLLQYYVVDNQPLRLRFSTHLTDAPEFELLESSFDLHENPAFGLTSRPADLMPLPFVLNDAVIVKQKIKLSESTLDGNPDNK
jgi:hypothetical protein